MIKKLKLRYLVTNMALLSGTLMICLAVLFGIMYHSEISSSYTVMQEMLKDANMPSRPRDEVSPTAMDIKPEIVSLSEEMPQDPNGGQQGAAPNDQNPGNQQQYWGGAPQYYTQYPPNLYWYYPQPENNAPEQNQDQQQNNQQQQPEQNQQQNPSQNDQQQNNQQDTSQNPNGYWGTPSPWNWWSYQPYPYYGNPYQQEEPRQTTAPAITAPPVTTTRAHEYRPSFTFPFWFYTTAAASETLPPETQPSAAEPRTERNQTQKNPATTETTAAPVAAAPVNTDTPDQTPQDEKVNTTEPIIPIEEGKYVPDALIAEIDPNGNIEFYGGMDSQNPGDDSLSTINKAMDSVRKRGSAAGTVDIGNRSFRYATQMDPTGNLRMILLDRSVEHSTLQKMVFVFMLITVFGLLVMFGISLTLANWTVKPIAVAWEKQKQFVADASHELKTPLAVISANTEVILANPRESVSGQSKWLNYIQSETMRMSKLISNLLSVARMDHESKSKMDIEQISLSDTVSNICLVFEPIIYENGKTLNTIIHRDILFRAEEDNVKQLLSILMDNAVLHSVPKAEITVTLSRDAQGKIRLAVSNTAKDIPQEKLAHLFDRFYRVDTEGSPNGSGLGLSIAKSIVTQMGGKLSVTSENNLVTFTAQFS